MKEGEIYPFYCREGLREVYIAPVTIMAIRGNYAMLTRKGNMPFVKSIKDLKRWQKMYNQGITGALNSAKQTTNR